MAKKLTPLEKENRDIENIVNKIIAMESRYKNKEYFRLACSRFVRRRTDENRLRYRIKDAEEELKSLKTGLG